ncbi:protein TsetseEP [Stomoxys calcitrans]|uniref:Protein TsetseEP domain-containing protein n=1 Tax=Stomoxys calcitrans TaxID=35570 RepID=A0A1I8PF69_STOCA|nr:protein TsetseEP [Stomoxys calcitrans]
MLALTLLVLALASQGVFSVPMSLDHEAQKEMANAIERTSQSMRDNPERSAECFAVYSQGITAANEKYELAYSKCVDTAAEELQRVEAEVAEDRNSVRSAGEAVCSSFQVCSNKESSADFFECYLEAASASLTSSLDMQTVSKTKMQYVNLRYQTIEYNKVHCSDECSNTYMKETTTLFNQLDECLKTGVPVPPVVPTEPSPPTETTGELM